MSVLEGRFDDVDVARLVTSTDLTDPPPIGGRVAHIAEAGPFRGRQCHSDRSSSTVFDNPKGLLTYRSASRAHGRSCGLSCVSALSVSCSCAVRRTSASGSAHSSLSASVLTRSLSVHQIRTSGLPSHAMLLMASVGVLRLEMSAIAVSIWRMAAWWCASQLSTSGGVVGLAAVAGQSSLRSQSLAAVS